LSGRDDKMLEQIVARLSLEESVSAVSWQLLPASGAHPASEVAAVIEETGRPLQRVPRQ
jgi:hypothetical protein